MDFQNSRCVCIALVKNLWWSHSSINSPFPDSFPLDQLNHAIHSSLIIREQVPAQYAYARVEEGMLQLVDADNFTLSLMLESPEPASAPWRLLDIQLLFPPQVRLVDI